MRSDYDVDLPDDTGDETYLAHLNKWLPYLFSTYHPKLVFYQAGVDALAEDTFGRLGKELSQAPRSACAIAHTRPAKGALRPEGRIPSDCYHNCLRNTMEYSISNPSYYGVQYTLPNPSHKSRPTDPFGVHRTSDDPYRNAKEEPLGVRQVRGARHPARRNHGRRVLETVRQIGRRARGRFQVGGVPVRRRAGWGEAEVVDESVLVMLDRFELWVVAGRLNDVLI